MLTLSFFALPFIKKMWSMHNTSSSEDEKNNEISADTTIQEGDSKPVQKEEDYVDRMSTDLILQNPVWAAIYRRGWSDRSVNFQHSQKLGRHDQNFDKTVNSDRTTCSLEHSEPSPAVKVRTDAQRARIRKNFLKLKEKKKAKRQLANEQQCQLAMPLEPILDPEASVVLDLLEIQPLQARTEKTCGPVDLEPDPTTLQFDWVEEVEKFLQDHPTWNALQ